MTKEMADKENADVVDKHLQMAQRIQHRLMVLGTPNAVMPGNVLLMVMYAKTHDRISKEDFLASISRLWDAV